MMISSIQVLTQLLPALTANNFSRSSGISMASSKSALPATVRELILIVTIFVAILIISFPKRVTHFLLYMPKTLYQYVLIAIALTKERKIHWFILTLIPLSIHFILSRNRLLERSRLSLSVDLRVRNQYISKRKMVVSPNASSVSIIYSHWKHAGRAV